MDKCSICTHPKVTAINEALLREPIPYRQILTDYRVSLFHLSRHKKQHLVAEPPQTPARTPTQDVPAPEEELDPQLQRPAMVVFKSAWQAMDKPHRQQALLWLQDELATAGHFADV
jgi:hypothetical protein